MAGNQIALNLVTTGLKLTPCTPGFVDGRDAILAADAALYPHPDGRRRRAAPRPDLGGVRASRLWACSRARARPASTTTARPTSPRRRRSTCLRRARRQRRRPSSTFEVSTVAPNPSSRSTRVAVTVDRAQSRRGRPVRCARPAGPSSRRSSVSPGTARDLEVALEGLPAGVYALRVTGETASETRSLTVVR